MTGGDDAATRVIASESFPGRGAARKSATTRVNALLLVHRRSGIVPHSGYVKVPIQRRIIFMLRCARDTPDCFVAELLIGPAASGRTRTLGTFARAGRRETERAIFQPLLDHALSKSIGFLARSLRLSE